jgi:ABC-2 type transport system ATP-binding protein
MRVKTPEPDRLLAVVQEMGLSPRRLAADVVAVDGTTPEQLGPLLAANRIVIYELVQESQDLEALFLSLTTPYGAPAAPTGQWAPPPVQDSQWGPPMGGPAGGVLGPPATVPPPATGWTPPPAGPLPGGGPP